MADKESLVDDLEDRHWRDAAQICERLSLWCWPGICAMNEDAMKCLGKGDDEVVRDLDVDRW